MTRAFGAYPDHKLKLNEDDIPRKRIARGAQLIRIYNHVDAGGRYGPFDYNPKLVIDKPDVRGRFSARESRHPDDWYSYLYVGEGMVDERVVLSECIDIKSLGRTPDGKRRMIDLGTISNLAFAYTISARPLTLVDLSTSPNADKIKADFDRLHGVNYRLTRRWARYIRKIAPWADGIYYCPVRYRSTADGGNLMLFAPHGGNGGHVSDDVSEVQFTSATGKGMLFDLEESLNLSFVDMTA